MRWRSKVSNIAFFRRRTTAGLGVGRWVLGSEAEHEVSIRGPVTNGARHCDRNVIGETVTHRLSSWRHRISTTMQDSCQEYPYASRMTPGWPAKSPLTRHPLLPLTWTPFQYQCRQSAPLQALRYLSHKPLSVRHQPLVHMSQANLDKVESGTASMGAESAELIIVEFDPDDGLNPKASKASLLA